MQKKTIIILAICLTFLSLIGYSLHRFVSVDDLAACGEKPTTGSCAPADAIVVISGGDTRARTDEAVALFKAGWAPALLVSGAAQDVSGPSNASAMRDDAIEAGVPSWAILVDETAQNTNQNAFGAAALAKEQDIKNIIVVTSPYHLVRTRLVFERAFAEFGIVRGHPSNFDNNWPSHWWLTPRGWWLVGGELIKSSAELMRGNLKYNE